MPYEPYAPKWEQQEREKGSAETLDFKETV
jgi:hypothetical protein